MINLGELNLVTFDVHNMEHRAFLKELTHDETILKWFQGITTNLIHGNNSSIFGRSFFVCDNNGTLVAYINIGNFNDTEKAVYLRAATHKEQRGKGIGKTLLQEITAYIFANYNEVEVIKLKINPNNKASLNTAGACGYKWLESDYYGKYNPNLLEDLENKETR